MTRNRLIILILFGISIFLYAQPDSQWRGPNRNGVYPETGLLREWPSEGPELLWTTEGIGAGFSSAAVTKRMIYTAGKKDTVEYITAIDHQGAIQWQLPYGLAGRQAYPETRCIPTVEGDRIYHISGRGEVTCIDAARRKKMWSVAAYEKFEGKHETWEIAESPLLVDDKVIYTPGGYKTTMVALDKYTGKIVWMSESLHDSTAYVSPLLIQLDHRKIITNVTANHIFGVDAADGRMLWKYKYGDIDRPTWHPRAPIINCNTPVYDNDCIFVTSGYDHVGAMFKLSDNGSRIEFVWKAPALDTHHGGVVHVGGYIYGSNWLSNSKGNWVCLDWQTGNVMYEKEWQTKGSIIAADGMLYCYDERRGNIALVKATPEDFEIVSILRVTHGSGPHWAHPVIQDGVLYVRHGDVLMAYDIRRDTS